MNPYSRDSLDDETRCGGTPDDFDNPPASMSDIVSTVFHTFKCLQGPPCPIPDWNAVIFSPETVFWLQGELTAAAGTLCISHERLRKERDQLRDAIAKHRSQKADDRCIFDDDELYAALGDGIKCDRRVGDKVEMLTNCAKYITNRCEGGGWPPYVELENQIAGMQERIKELEAQIPTAKGF